MKFYHIKDDYIAFLRLYDTKVPDNKHESRPYVGVVLEIDGIKYYAPFSSPKQKHKHMRNGTDFRKIANGRYGAINFNNMIPVVDDALLQIDIGKISDKQYKSLLDNQYRAIVEDAENIKRTAEKLRTLLFKAEANLSEYEKSVKSRCCDLQLLEQVYSAYADKC